MTVISGYANATQGAAKAPPAIPGLEQGNPAVTNRQAPAPPPPGQSGVPGQSQAPGDLLLTGTRDEVREQIRTMVRNSIRNGDVPVLNVPTDFVRNAVPQGAVDISVAFFVCVAVIIVGTPLARALARRMDTENKAKLSGASTIAPQIEQMQQSLDAMAIELERITEAQRFQSRLMAGREKEPEPAKLHR